MVLSLIPNQVSPLRKWAFHATAAILIFLILLACSAVCDAADYHVSTTDDSGAGSLRQAISDANSGDAIVFDAAVGTDAFNISSPLDPLASITFRDAAGTRLIFDAGSAGGHPMTDYTLKFQNNATLSGALPGTVSYTTTGSYASVICSQSDLTLADDLDGKISGIFGSNGEGVIAIDHITLQSGLSGEIEVTATDDSIYGLRSAREGVSITGDLAGSVKATAGTQYAYGFYSKTNIAINGALTGTVSSEAGTHTAYGLHAKEGDILITNDLSGTVSARAGTKTAYGLSGYNDLTIGGNLSGSVTATAGTSEAYALTANDNLIVSGALSGTVAAESGTDNAYGMKAGDHLTITGALSGSVSATAGTNSAFGLYSGDNKNMVLASGISGAVSAKAGGERAIGIYSLGTLSDGSGGAVSISGSVKAEAGGLAVGIGVKDGLNVHITGTVTAIDTSGSGKAYAIASGQADDDSWHVNSADTIDDTVTLENGASITGQIDLGSGSGTDTLTLNGGGTLNGAVSNITHMTKNGAGTWTTSGNIGARNLTINEGALSVSGQIDADTVSINAGTLSVEAENQTGEAYGLNTSNLSSSVAMTEDIAATASAQSAHGIRAGENITISGALSGAVSASTGSSGAYGLRAGENLTITGDLSGRVTATAGTDTAVGLSSGKDMVLGSDISGAIAAKAGASNALAVYSLGTLSDGSGGAVTMSGSVTAEAAGLAVGIGVEDGMNVHITGTVSATDTSGSGNAYAIASGHANGDSWSVNSADTIDDTVTLENGVSITGQIDLGSGSGTDTLTLNGGGTLNGAVSNITHMTKTGSGAWTTSGKIETTNLFVHTGTLSMDAETGHVVDGNLDVKAGTTLNAAVRQRETATIQVTDTATINGTVNFQMETFVPSEPGLVVISSGTLVDAGVYTVDNPFMAAAANGSNILITKEAYADRSLSSSNSRALAEMLDDASLNASGEMADLLTTLDDIDTLGEFHSCLEELETNPAFSAMGMDTARLFTSAVQTRMAEVRTRQSVIAQTCQMDPEDPFTWPLLASTGGVSPLISPRPPQKPNAFFIQALGRDGRLDSHDGYDGYDYDTTGFFVGWDRLQGRSFLVGASLGYAQTDVDYLDTGKSRSDVENYSGGFYGTWFGSNWYLDATLWAVYNTFDTDRNITFLNDTAESDAEGCTLSGKLDYGYRVSVASMGLTPLVSCEYAWFRQNDYSETGAGAANLNVDTLTNDSLKSGIGFNLDRPIHLKGMVIVPEVSGRWMHEFLSRERQYNVTMSGSPGIVFPQTLARAEEDSFRFGAGLTAVLTSGVSVAITYQGEQEKHAESQTLFGELRWPF